MAVTSPVAAPLLTPLLQLQPRLKDIPVPSLFVVPHSVNNGSTMPFFTPPFDGAIEARGYHCAGRTASTGPAHDDTPLAEDHTTVVATAICTPPITSLATRFQGIVTAEVTIFPESISPLSMIACARNYQIGSALVDQAYYGRCPASHIITNGSVPH